MLRMIGIEFGIYTFKKNDMAVDIKELIDYLGRRIEVEDDGYASKDIRMGSEYTGVLISVAEAEYVLDLLKSGQLRDGSCWRVRIKYLNPDGDVVFQEYLNTDGHLMESFNKVKGALENMGNKEVSLLGMEVYKGSIEGFGRLYVDNLNK